MTNHTQQYQLAGEVEQHRLDELTQRDHGSVADLTHEIGMCRFLVERNSSNPALCNALLSTCAKLCASHQLAMERAAETLPRDLVLRIARAVCDAVAIEFSDLPEWEDRWERALGRIDSVFDQVARPEQTPLLLKGPDNDP